MTEIYRSIQIIFHELSSILLSCATWAGVIAFIFQIDKIRLFIVSFFYMRKAGFKALLLRFNLSIEEMRLINEFVICSALPIVASTHISILPFSSFINPPAIGKRIAYLKDMPGFVLNPDRPEDGNIQFRLPSSDERIALISLTNKGLIVPSSMWGHLGSDANSTIEGRQFQRDIELSNCIISDKFIYLFK